MILRLKRLIYGFWKAFLFLADGLVTLLPPSRVPGGRVRVLLVRPDAIGDFVLWLDAARGLRRKFPAEKYEWTLVANGLWASFAEGTGLFDRVVALDRRAFMRDLGYRFRMLLLVRGLPCGILLHPVFSREFLVGDVFARVCVAEEKVAFDGDLANISPRQKVIGNRWYTRLVGVERGGGMELSRNADFVRALGVEGFRSSLPVLDVPAGDPLVEGDYCVFFPGASLAGKRWSLDNFRELGRRIHERTAWRVVVAGGPGEGVLAEGILRDAKFPALNFAGKTDLHQLGALLGGARCFVGNDTGAAHMAAATGVPTVCIVGGGHFGRFFPYEVARKDGRRLPEAVFERMDCFDCNWRCVHGEYVRGEAFPCVARVSVDVVFERVMAVAAG